MSDQKFFQDYLELKEYLEYLLSLSDAKVLGYFCYDENDHGNFDPLKAHDFFAIFASYNGDRGTHFTLDCGRFSLLEFDTETGETRKFINTAFYGDRAQELYVLLAKLDNKIN